jgi:CDGSH iron-sulfur domain-containing protein 3
VGLVNEEPQVVIKVRDNGPYKVTGPVRIVDVDGNAWELPEGAVVLCRCGQSRTKPFCDSSHKSSGFSSCERVSGVRTPDGPTSDRVR